MSCHLGTDSPPHAGRPAPQTPLLRLLSGQGQDAGRAKPGQKEQQPQTLSLRLARERLLAGPGGPGLGSFAAPAVSGALLFPRSQACLEPSGFFLDVVPDILSSQLLQVLLSGSGPVCTPGDASDPHRGGVVVGGGRQEEGAAPIRAALISRGGSCLPLPASGPPGSPGLWPHPSASASVPTRPPTSRSVLSHQEARWIYSSPGSPSVVSSQDRLRGAGGEFASGNTAIGLHPIVASGVCAFRERCSSHQRLLLFSCKHPGDRRWRGQPARRLTPKFAT